MVQLPATIGRVKLEQTAAGLRIVIPAYRHLYNFWEVVVLRPVLALICLAALWRIFADSPVFMGLVTTAVATGVTIKWAWKGFGREIITVDRVALTLRWEIGAIGRSRSYIIGRMTHMRFITPIRPTKRNILDWNYVIFDYQGSVPWTEFVASFVVVFFGRGRSYDPHTPRFGRGLSESEGQELVRAVQSVAAPACQLS
ncbi:MAG TPA: hypothetical protein VGP35_07710 [Terriglobales bacterium]|nr:hypothetical protein [Terriglobales bacterium]